MKKKLKTLAALLMAAIFFSHLWAVAAFAARSVLFCDIDMDNKIEAEDARLAMRMAIGLENYTAAHKKLADADEDGSVTPADARIILRVAVGLEDGYRTTINLWDAELKTYVYKGASSTIGQYPNNVPETTEPATYYDAEPEEPTTNYPSSADPSGKTPSSSNIKVPMPTPSSVSGTFTITSYGWGDGVGMSQNGAVGMAKEGYTYKQILQHYFTGIKIVKDSSYPSSSNYLGTYYNTEELVARMVYAEIYGAVDDEPPGAEEALKAQAVALFSLLEYFDFSTYDSYAVGALTSRSYSNLPSIVRSSVHSVIGEYIALSNDSSNTPVQALYFATAALRTASAKDVWGYDYPHLQAVDSPYDIDGYLFSNTFTVSKSYMREMIMSYDSSIQLSSDPSQWVKILAHSASIDKNRGYVTKVQVGNRVMDGYTFCSEVIEDYFWSSEDMGCSTAFYITYTP